MSTFELLYDTFFCRGMRYDESEYLLIASSEAKRTCPGTMFRNAFPAWDLTTGVITDPVTRPTPSSIDLLNFDVIFDNLLALKLAVGEKLKILLTSYSM